jgi:hypothetical protein
MYCDGVRYAIEMLDRSYLRLVAELEATASTETTDECPAIFLDAWSVVDSANRLRVLTSSFPNMKKNAPALRLLHGRLSQAEALRNSIQHLPGDIQEYADRGTPTWGVLHWTRLDSDPNARQFMLVPGGTRSMKGLGPILSPAGRPFAYNPDHVTLTAFDAKADLSAIHRAVARYVPSLEVALVNAFKGQDERSGSDLLLTMQLRFDEVGSDGPQALPDA